MSKLSRKDKYKDLRQAIDQQPVPNGSRPSRLSRMAAPDARAEQRKAPQGNPVIDDLLGEVREYNISTGETAAEDPQLQILHELTAKEQADARRSEHLEVMEPHEDDGGTTRNLLGSDLSAIMAAASKTPASSTGAASASKPAAPKAVMQEEEEADYLDLFAPGQKQTAQVEQTEEIEVISEPSSRSKGSIFGRSRKQPKKARAAEDTMDSLFETSEIFTPDLTSDQQILTRDAAASAQDEQDYFAEKPKKGRKKADRQTPEPAEPEAWHEEQESPSAGKGPIIFMIVCCVILVILIVLTIFWMSKLGIF